MSPLKYFILAIFFKLIFFPPHPKQNQQQEHFTGYDTDQNYVNHVKPTPSPPATNPITNNNNINIVKQQQQKSPSPPVPQPVRTTTPVIISVQLPEGRVSVNNSPITIQQVTRSSPVIEVQQRSAAESPPYAVAKKQTMTTKVLIILTFFVIFVLY